LFVVVVAAGGGGGGGGYCSLGFRREDDAHDYGMVRYQLLSD
jgi:hypothetical protein